MHVKETRKPPLIPTPFRVPCEAPLPSNSRMKCFFFHHHCISIICPLNSTRCTYPVIRDHPIKHIEPCTTRQTLLHCAATALHCPATETKTSMGYWRGYLHAYPPKVFTLHVYYYVLLCVFVVLPRPLESLTTLGNRLLTPSIYLGAF